MNNDWFLKDEEKKLEILKKQFIEQGKTPEEAIREAEIIVYSRRLQPRPTAISLGERENEYLITFKLDDKEKALFITAQFSMHGNKFNGNELYEFLKKCGRQKSLEDFK